MKKKRIFTRKPFSAFLYKWSPDESLNVTKFNLNLHTNPTSCTAQPFTQGIDWVTAYVYNVVIVDGKEQHSAYVECDYVK